MWTPARKDVCLPSPSPSPVPRERPPDKGSLLVVVESDRCEASWAVLWTRGPAECPMRIPFTHMNLSGLNYCFLLYQPLS